MLIWILAFLLFAIMGGIGFLLGGVRSAIILAGLAISAVLAPALGIFAALLAVAFVVAAFVVHHKMARHYRFQSGDVDWLRWQRVNRRLGACLGIVPGVAALILISVPIYVLGYTTVQVSEGENDILSLKLLNRARHDLSSTGLDRVAARYDQGLIRNLEATGTGVGTREVDLTPEQYYTISDIVGLLYHNPPLRERMALYPPFLTHGESIQLDLFQQTGDQGQNLGFMLLNMSGLVLAQDQQGVDLNDLHNYLRTGKSPIYDQEPILGRWEVDPDSLIAQVRRMKPNITSTELIMLKRAIDSLAGVSFVATPDKKASLQFKAPQAEAAPQAEEDPYNDPYGIADRYGAPPPRPGTQPQRPRAPAAPTAPANPFQVFLKSAQGQWSHEQGQYRIRLQAQGQELSFTAEADQDTLVISEGGQVLVFYRAY